MFGTTGAIFANQARLSATGIPQVKTLGEYLRAKIVEILETLLKIPNQRPPTAPDV